MRNLRIWARLLGVKGCVLEAVELEGESVVVKVHSDGRGGKRCGICGKRGPIYDQGDGRRRWRALDLGSTRCYLEASAPRISCLEHGVVVVQVS
ncbi:MAG: transposase family protein [Candidatus Dormibacteraceae bacterium]